MGQEKKRVRELRDGDLIDLLELGEDYPLDEVTRTQARFMYASVTSEGDNDTPFIVESTDTWVLTTTLGAFGVSPDHEFTIQGRIKRG